MRASLRFRDSFIGVGLDSTEVGHPPVLFQQVYAMAAAEGLRLVAHAGEEGGSLPLPAMLDAGLLATVNSDDPAYFGGYLDDNLAAVQREFGFGDEQLAGLARNSFDACFAPEADKARWQAEVDSWLAAQRA
ncbi:MAG TPA: hypothetical protein VHO07_28615 [Streptosporangiaceae bacterium]|jgi:adenosine deaminase|nr:hypothetical protein [Streptosporangiaceae bacterium]